MLHHQKASDGKTYSSSATVQYNLTVTYESATYEYPISMKYCPKMYQDYIKSTTPARKACFLNEPVLGTHFAVAMQAAEGLSGTIGKEARYGFATDSICNKCAPPPDEKDGPCAGVRFPECGVRLKRMCERVHGRAAATCPTFDIAGACAAGSSTSATLCQSTIYTFHPAAKQWCPSAARR